MEPAPPHAARRSRRSLRATRHQRRDEVITVSSPRKMGHSGMHKRNSSQRTDTDTLKNWGQHGTLCSARKRTARRSGKLVKRIVAVASLCLDGLDVVAHFLPGKVGGAPFAVPEGHAGVPVVDHRLGLAELAIPAREWHGAGVSYRTEGARTGCGSAKVRRCHAGACARAVIGAAAGQGGGSLLLAEVVGDLEHRLALTCRGEAKQSVSAILLHP